MPEIKEYKYIKLQPADNGFVLEYTELSERKEKGVYDGCDHNDRQIVYPDGEGGIDEALSKMKELYMFNRTKKAGDISMAPTNVEIKVS